MARQMKTTGLTIFFAEYRSSFAVKYSKECNGGWIKGCLLHFEFQKYQREQPLHKCARANLHSHPLVIPPDHPGGCPLMKVRAGTTSSTFAS